MKRNLWLTLAAMSCAFGLVACDDDADKKENPQTPDQTCTDDDCGAKPGESCTGDDCGAKPGESCTGNDCGAKPDQTCTGDDCDAKPGESCTGNDCSSTPSEEPEGCTGDDCENTIVDSGDTPDSENQNAEEDNPQTDQGGQDDGTPDVEEPDSDPVSEEEEEGNSDPSSEDDSESGDDDTGTTPVEEETVCTLTCDDSTHYLSPDCKCVAYTCSPTCEAGFSCTQGKCLCGGKTCKSGYTCESDKCVDPCSKCGSNETCVDAVCQPKSLTINYTSLAVRFSTYSSALTVTVGDGSTLTWSVEKAPDSAYPDYLTDVDATEIVRCKYGSGSETTFLKTTPSNLAKCVTVGKDSSGKRTESIRLLNYKRHMSKIKITAKDKSGNSVSSMLYLKPYYGTSNLVKLSGFAYRNCLTPGSKLLDGSEDKYKNYKDSYAGKGNNGSSGDQKNANLGAKDNTYGGIYFDDQELAVFDRDMYNKYVAPKMLSDKDGNLYGTRASVVAAARFLILQFPYDIPYHMAGTNYYASGRSHYAWHTGKLTTRANAVTYGLNLTSNAYNSLTEHATANIKRTKNIPWGSLYGDASKYEYNGLECSGFVNWALRNGGFGLGDWTTHMFSKTGLCLASDGKTPIRNFRCKGLVNHTATNKLRDSQSNPNNVNDDVYEKLSALQDSDFVQLNTIDKTKTDTLKEKLKYLKAGDLLWKAHYITKEFCKEHPNSCSDIPSEGITYSSQGNAKLNGKVLFNGKGHVAMIIGIQRDSNGLPIVIDVAEAISTSGNTLNHWVIENTYNKNNSLDFRNSDWYDGKASFVIKMGNVYNYYSKKYNITTKSDESDCFESKSGGNCYMYTDMFNKDFYALVKKYNQNY